MKRRSSRIRSIVFSLLLFVTACFSAAYSAFVVGGDLTSEKYGISEGLPAVCYNGSTYYTTIEKALENASAADTIYVIEGADATITRDCIVPANVTLCMPYGKDDSNNPIYHSYLAQSPTLAHESGTRVSRIKVSSGHTLTNYGTIIIGAIQNTGSGGNYYSGNATKSYTEIELQGNSVLYNYGTIQCYGYISAPSIGGGAKVVNGTTTYGGTAYAGKIYAPFTVMEHRGGSIFTGMSSNDVGSMLVSAVAGGTTADLTCFPFLRFFVDCFLRVNFRLEYGSFLYGYAALEADGQTNTTTMDLFGNTNDYLFNLSSGSLLTGYFDSSTKINYLDFKGSFALRNMQLDLAIVKSGLTAKIKLSTASVLLPISYFYDITLSPFEDGTAATMDFSKQGIKLLPGAKLTVQPKVTLNASKVAVYKNSDFYPGGTYIATINVGTPYYPQKDDASFVINGTAKIAETGGTLSTSQSTGSLTISSANTLTSPEIVDTTDAKATVVAISLSYKKPTYANIGLTATGKQIERAASKENTTDWTYENSGERTLNVSDSYTSMAASSSSDVCWYNASDVKDRYNLAFNLGTVSCTNPNTITTIGELDGSVGVSPLVPDSDDYIFEGFYYSSDFSSGSALTINEDGKYVLNGTTACGYGAAGGTNTVTLYAKWSVATTEAQLIFQNFNSSGALESVGTYTITVGNSYDISTYSEFNEKRSRPTYYLYESGGTRRVVYKIDYTFTKWVVKDGTGTMVNTGNTFTAVKGQGYYYVVPEYTQAKQYAIYFTNSSHLGQNIITSFTIGGVSATSGSSPNYAYESSVLSIKTYGARYWTANAVITVGSGGTTVSSSKNTAGTFSKPLSFFSAYLPSLTTPITVVATRT